MKRNLFLIIALSVALRLAAVFYMGNEVQPLPGIADQVSYHALAQRVLAGHGFTFDRAWWPATPAGEPTAHWSYLYTFFLVAVYAVFGPHAIVARVVQAVIVGALHPLLAFRIGARIFNERIGLIYAGLTAVYIYFIYYAAALMTESFYITAILAVLYLTLRLGEAGAEPGPERKAAVRWLSLSVAVVFGVAVLLRQLLLLFLPFILAWLWLRMRRRSYLPAATIVGILAIMILPFTVFNFIRFERFVLLNTNAGFAFFWANHPIYGTQFQPILPPEMGSYQDLIPPELWGLNEAAMDQELLKRGLQFVLEDPIRYLQLSVSRIPAYFKFWPSADSSTLSNLSRVGSFGLFLPFMLIGLVQIYASGARSRWALDSELNLLSLFMFVYTAIHILSWSLIRYRLPVGAVLLLFAAYSLNSLYVRLVAARPRLGKDLA